MRLDAGEHAIRARLDLDYRFIGFHLEQRLTLADDIAFFFQPRDNLSTLLRHLQRRHYNTSCHNVC